MRYFENNVRDGDEVVEQCEVLLKAVHDVVNDSMLFKSMEDGDGSMVCMSIYVAIGLCEAMLQAFPEECREKAFEVCDEYFSGEFGRNRNEVVRRLAADVLGI